MRHHRLVGWMPWCSIFVPCLLVATVRAADIPVASVVAMAKAAQLGGTEELLRLDASFMVADGGGEGLLLIRGQLAKGWHTYSITQKRGGPIPTAISLTQDKAYHLLAEFHPETPPTARQEPLFDNLVVEEHHDAVTWIAPVAFAPDADPARLAIGGAVRAQLCDATGCRPPKNHPITARRKETQDSVRGPHVTIQGRIDAPPQGGGSDARLVLSIEPANGYHAYALAARDPKNVNKPTLVVLTETGGLTVGKVSADRPVVEVESDILPGEKVQYYQGPVAISVELSRSDGIKPGAHVISGLLGYQTCTDESCDPPAAVRFLGTVRISDSGEVAGGKLVFAPSKYGEAAAAADALASIGVGLLTRAEIPDAGDPTRNLPVIFGLAFLAGLILNVMPCVLPVIGLKILSFLHQAGESRAKIFVLNVWYTLGILAVFMALATAAVGFGLGWGDQFRDARFTISMAAVVWACALSFLGIWEIPIPGFAMSRSANQAAAKEGPLGAFLKGILTTLLATPCTGPFLITTLTWAIRQPAPVTYATFATMGLGMASPYLVIGAFPGLAGFLPKPGPWMNTFKQMMGFILMGTVVFLLYSIPSNQLHPVLGLLVGISLACFWIGRVPLTAERATRRWGWIISVAIVAISGFGSFALARAESPFFGSPPSRWLIPAITVAIGLAFGAWWIFRVPRSASLGVHLRSWTVSAAVAGLAVLLAIAPERLLGSNAKLPWEEFSRARLETHLRAGKTVLVDFTADWCWSCKWNEHSTLNTADTLEIIRRYGVVPLLADKTHDSPEIDEMLSELGNASGGIPFLAIFPARDPDRPIILQNLITKKQLAQALRRAGPSKDAEQAIRLASTQSP